MSTKTQLESQRLQSHTKHTQNLKKRTTTMTTLHDTMPRFFTNNPVLTVIVLLLGSAWFILSVMFLIFAAMSTRKRPTQQAESNTIYIVASSNPQSASQPGQVATAGQPQSMLVPRDANYRVTFAEVASDDQRRLRKAPPPMIAVVPSQYGSITITTTDAPPPVSAPVPGAEAAADDTANAEAAASERPEQQLAAENSRHKKAIKAIGVTKVAKVFRRKSRRASGDSFDEGESSRASTPPVSPQKRLAELLPEDGNRRVLLTRRKSYHKPEDDREFLRTRFVNPLRFKPRRAHTTHTFCNDSPDLSPSPSPPSSFSYHKRIGSFASVVGSVMRTRSRSISPNRSSFSSCATSSAASSSSIASPCTSPTPASSPASASSHSRSASSIRSSVCSKRLRRSSTTSDRDSMPRTQPYGAPYYAPLPVPVSSSRPHMHRASLSHTGVVIKNLAETELEQGAGRHPMQARLLLARTLSGIGSDEDDAGEVEVEVRSTGVDASEGSGLGLKLGGGENAVSRRRHHSVHGGTGAVR